MSFTKFISAAMVASALSLSSGIATNIAFAQSEAVEAQILADRTAAQQAFSEGRPEDALSLIEKVIIASPVDLSARFFRAQVLVTLERGAEIREELVLMSKLKLPKKDKLRAKQLIDAIDKKDSRLSGKATIKFGVGYTDNANSWPKNGSYTYSSGVVVDLPDPVYEKEKKQSDTLKNASLSLYGAYEITEARDLKAIFNLSASIDDASTTVNKDKKTFSGGGALEYTFATDTSIKAGISQSKINRVNYHNDSNVSTDLKQTTMDIGVNQKFGSVATGVRHVQSTSDASVLATADQSDATTKTNSIFAGLPFGDGMYTRATLSMGKSRTDATKDLAKSRDKVDKDINSLSVILVKVLPYQQRLIASASVSESKFKTAEVGPNIKRKDTTNSFSLKYSIQGEELLTMLDGFELGSSISTSSTSSNQESSKVQANTIMFTISRRFDLF